MLCAGEFGISIRGPWRMRLSWNEIRARAVRFADEWKDAHYERGDTQTFYNEFFEIFGITRRRVASYEAPVRLLGEKRGFVDLFWKGTLLIEQKSAGRDLAKAKRQAFDYFPGLKESELPRYILLSDFQTFELYDLDENTEVTFRLRDLPAHIEAFGFMVGVQKRTFKDQDPVNIEASELMGKLHDALKESGYEGHDLEQYLVRLLFCLFADDTGIFEPKDILLTFIQDRTSADGSDLGARINELFEVLNTPEDRRQKKLDEDLNQFPYVNGDLFRERLPVPAFDAAMRSILIEACEFKWEAISPAIFGALFQSVMNAKERRASGAHYTTEKNILKVIQPLFLDELREEFAKLKARKDNGRRNALIAFQKKLGGLKFLDPACGCGNFLIIAYRELRLLELELLQDIYPKQQRVFDVTTLSKINVDQFYGIEIGEFPARIAEVAMWMMDHIMNNRLSLSFGEHFARIPLRASPHILHADALEADWAALLPAGSMFLCFRQSALHRLEVSDAGAAPASSRHRQTRRQRRHARLCDGVVPESGRLCAKRQCGYCLRRHQLDHAGRTGGAALAASVSTLQARNRFRASHIRMGFGCARRRSCPCRDCRVDAARQGKAHQAAVQLCRYQGRPGGERT